MKWGVRRYQPYPRGYTGNGKEVGKAKRVQQREQRITKRFDRIDKKVAKSQTIANENYQRAVSRSSGIFKNSKLASKSASRAFDRASSAQKKANKLTYRGSLYYKSYERYAKKMNIPMNDEIKKRGMNYLNDVILGSKSAYQIALSRKIKSKR